MKKKTRSKKIPLNRLTKVRTGIEGLDEITFGGLPKGRPTLICGTAGCGKTLMAIEFLINGAIKYGENGVFIAFEETPEDLAKNVASLGYNLDQLIADKKIYVDYININPSEMCETGDFDLEGLFIRIQLALDSVKAKRLSLDTLEMIFGGFTNQSILRSELQRLFHWTKERGLSTIITAERGDGTLTRQGLEEYVSDCVILLDHRINDQISTRRLRIVKYRGSVHGTNEYPFLIDETGISILPISSLSLDHEVSAERISSGIPSLDDMLEKKGFYRGSSILVTGTAGVGKTSISAHFANSICKKGKRCLYFAFEESVNQIVRNMKSIGVNLDQWIKKENLKIIANRPSLYGLEMHLVSMHKLIEEFKPDVVIIDPITNLFSIGSQNEITSTLIRLIDYLKSNQITAMMTSLISLGKNADLETSSTSISSIIDTWILLRDIELNGERNRGIYILKSRGMAHSNQIREFLITSDGIDLKPVYMGLENVLTGSARIAQEAKEKASNLLQQQEIERKRLEIKRRQKALEAKIEVLKAEYEAENLELLRSLESSEVQISQALEDKKHIASSRKV